MPKWIICKQNKNKKPFIYNYICNLKYIYDWMKGQKQTRYDMIMKQKYKILTNWKNSVKSYHVADHPGHEQLFGGQPYHVSSKYCKNDDSYITFQKYKYVYCNWI